MFLQVRRPNKQCQSTEGGWLVDLQKLIEINPLIFAVNPKDHKTAEFNYWLLLSFATKAK